MFVLDPAITFLNHGSYGATPHPVLDEQTHWRKLMEAQPVHFMNRVLPEALNKTRMIVGDFLSADPSGLAFVRNATAGANAVLQSLKLTAGDEILTTSHRYEAVGNTMKWVADRMGVSVITTPIPFPVLTGNEIISRIQNHITSRTKLLVVDHISSMTSVVFPIPELVQLARDHQIPILVDGAHAPGQLSVNLNELGADFWVGNFHKWMCAPKGSAILWVAPQYRDLIHPPVISLKYEHGFHEEFDWCGTDDPTAWLATPAAIELHRQWGGSALRAAHRQLLDAACALLREQLKVSIPQSDKQCAMASFLLPLSPEKTQPLYEHLLRNRIEVFLQPWQTASIMRISTFSKYNHLSQYQSLADAVCDFTGQTVTAP